MLGVVPLLYDEVVVWSLAGANAYGNGECSRDVDGVKTEIGPEVDVVVLADRHFALEAE